MRPATARHVLNADDAQIIEEGTEAQHECDLALFRRWHQRRGTDPAAALEELRLRTERHVRDLAEENGRGHKVPREATEQPGPDTR